jgi:2-aminoadipate transaminase
MTIPDERTAVPVKTLAMTPGADGVPPPPLSRRATRMLGSVIDSSTSLLARQQHDIVTFAMGSPAAEAIPTAAFAEIATHDVFAPGSAAPFGYAATEGDPVLRAALASFLAGTPEAVDPERLLITSGGMQGLDLACKLFVDPGDLVAVESPTYTNGSATVLSYEGEVLEVPVDENGMVVELLPELVQRAGRTPRMIYVIPNFQNPSGTTLSLERRLRLLELAEQWDAVILDDDPYGLLRFQGVDVPGFLELSGGAPRVVAVRTFSKTVAPGLRVGWVIADPTVVNRMIDAKQGMDTCTNLPAQRLIASFLNRGLMHTHLAGLRKEYLQRKTVMQAALAEHLGDVATWTDPEGGFFLWLTLPADVDATTLFPVALEQGVAFIPGAAFSVAGRFSDALRLCFASTGPERTHEGIRRLAAAIQLVRAQPAGAAR